jgi:hypothetical protein
MTYVFEWRHEGVEEGGEVWKRLRDLHRKVCFSFLFLVFSVGLWWVGGEEGDCMLCEVGL